MVCAVVTRRRLAGFLALLVGLYVVSRVLAPQAAQVKSAVYHKTAFQAKAPIGTEVDRPFQVGCAEPDTSAPRANATFVVLAQEKDLHELAVSVSSLERHFNRWFHYPYTILNDEPFSQEFQQTIRKYTSSDIEFGVIPKEHWEFPPEVPEEAIQAALDAQGDNSLAYGPLKSYHHMCRYFSGKFYHHPLLQKYEWYWRVEPNVQFFCDTTYDVFVEMEKHDKKYGFNVICMEFAPTIPNLFRYTQAFKMRKGIPDSDLWNIFTASQRAGPGRDDSGRDIPLMDGHRYPGCHFWTNFEISRVDFWKNPVYEEYFDYLDSKGGFWRERWGDAPVHTLGAALIANASDIHFFRDIGYSHTGIGNDPGNAPGLQTPLGQYNSHDSDWSHPDPEVKNGVGCRCMRPPSLADFHGHRCYDLIRGLFENVTESPAEPSWLS